MRRAALVAFWLSAVLAGWPSAVHAEVFRYVDEQGQSYYVDGLEHVPERFRRTAMPTGMRNTPARGPA